MAKDVIRDDVPNYGGQSFVTTELLERDNTWTPDFLELKKKSYHPVFVYGTLKAGGRLHGYLDGCPCLGDAYVAVPSMVMREALGAFPVALVADEHDKKANTHGHVYGEIYVVPAHVILELDRLEDNGNMYNRQERWVFCVDQVYSTTSGQKNPALKVWMYIGDEKYWSGVPTKGMAIERNREKDFYEFDQIGNRINSMISHLTK